MLAARAETSPRAYSPSPVGTHFVLLGFGHSWGDIIFEPSLPIEDANGAFNTPVAGLGTTFGVFGRQAQAAAVLPYAWGSAEGKIEGQDRRITRSGLADFKARFSFNVLGGPALSRQEFAAAQRNLAIGASIVVNVPTGDNTNPWV